MLFTLFAIFAPDADALRSITLIISFHAEGFFIQPERADNFFLYSGARAVRWRFDAEEVS